jgi:hypothetical protein
MKWKVRKLSHVTSIRNYNKNKYKNKIIKLIRIQKNKGNNGEMVLLSLFSCV